ncbi:MAG TPA: hypothetical protein VJ974_03650 [Geopsychrobacteraceae bacterium]|nr:hypothetical protein [Geopsychrobacteraceae bacterium]
MFKHIALSLFAVVLSGLLLAGCSGGVYKVPKDEYRKQVKTLGVLPIIVDDGSSIKHSQRDEIFSLLRRTAVGKIESAIEPLRKKKGYFDVRYVGENPQQLLRTLVIGPLPPVEGSGLPAGYRFSAQAASQIIEQKVVDALLVVIVSGVEHEERRRSRNKLETLLTVYNDIMATATVIDAQGRVLWEMAGEEAYRLLELQYPDFDEAYFNKTDEVAVKEITLAGLERTLTVEQKEGQPPIIAPAYQGLINQVVDGLSPSLLAVFGQ